MTSTFRGSAAGLARAALVLATAILAAACGSGAVTDNSTPAATPIAITPAAATLYSGLPTTFTWSGGNGNYIVISSDQAVVPVSGSTTANSLTIIPGAVAADTSATLFVRDSAGSQASATLTVKPRTISNVVTITPSPTQAAVCGTALCSGGDAEVKAKLTQNGVALANRDVRVEVVSGDVRVITSAPGLPETTSTSTTVRTDGTGTATVRIRAATDAPAQTAILQLTDVSGGFTQRASVAIYPVGAVALTATPATINFLGPNTNSCAIGTDAEVIVFGGRPPYQVSSPPAFIVTPTLLTSSGQRFRVSTTGQCATAQAIGIVDTNGASTTVTVSNAVGTTTLPSFAASPVAVTLNSCTDVANIALVGGTGSYFVASGSGALDVGLADNRTARIQRTTSAATTTPATNPSATPPVAPLNVAFSDGRSSVTVQVSIGTGATTCP